MCISQKVNGAINAKPLAYYFEVKTKISLDFQIKVDKGFSVGFSFSLTFDNWTSEAYSELSQLSLMELFVEK